ncbi:MAG: hypothetical protein SO170_10510 [Butyribacter sp.]|nr:hypothetical protein [bacterium]MDY3855367.1 hypothetical protein [Butyribacter sp.]
MLLKSKEIAYTGILMAIAVVLIILGGYFEGSTLFLLAAASFLAGIVERNFSVVTAFIFFAGTVLLGIFLAPQKLYCATFAVFCIYVIVAEFLEKKQFQAEHPVPVGIVWTIKGILYHILLLVSLVLTEKLFGLDTFLQQKWMVSLRQYQILFVVIMIICAEAVWIVFDRAYVYFQRHYGHYFQLKE